MSPKILITPLFLLGALAVLIVIDPWLPKVNDGTQAVQHSQSEIVDDTSSFGCGISRWAVKTGTDLDVGKVDLSTTTWISPGRLVKLATPSSLPADNRFVPTEDTIFRMTVTLLAFKEEADSDIHLRIQGSSGVQMIAEIPSPSCVQANSPFYSRIITARSAFQSLYGTVSGSWRYVNRPIALTGVGFFDFVHGATSQAQNGIELHPVLSVKVP